MATIETEWLHELFGLYDLYYLDPLVIKDASARVTRTTRGLGPLLSRFRPRNRNVAPPWYTTDAKSLELLLAKIRKVLGVDETNRDLGQFFEGGLQAKLLADRGKQKEIVDAIIVELGNSNRTHQLRRFETVADLSERKDHIQVMPNRNTSECLVSIDGVISRIDTESHKELYNSVVVDSRTEDRRVRLVRFCLADRPWPLLWIGDHTIGLMVDQKGLSKTYPNDTGTDSPLDVLRSDEWYPFAKVIGFWRSDRGGRPFVDVLAILIKTYPSMGEILKPRVSGPKRKFLQLLEDGRDAVEREIDALSAGNSYDSGTSDFRLLYPYLLSTLFCHLNNTDWTRFITRSKALYDLADDYRKALLRLVEQIKSKGADSMLPAYFDVMKTSSLVLYPH